MHEGRRGNQCIPIFHTIRHMKSSALSSDRQIDRENPPGKGSQHMRFKPSAQDGTLSPILSLRKENTGFNFKNGDRGNVEDIHRDFGSP